MQNVVGAQIRRLRSSKGWTQEVLAARCNVQGWDISRATLAKIEAEIRCVSDAELFVFATVFAARMEDLFPSDRNRIRRALLSK